MGAISAFAFGGPATRRGALFGTIAWFAALTTLCTYDFSQLDEAPWPYEDHLR